jgi:hypothetical protein
VSGLAVGIKQLCTVINIDVKNIAVTIKAMGMRMAIISWGSPSKLATSKAKMPEPVKMPIQTST